MNKKKLYNSIMESVSKELQNILQFDNSYIFNKEESQYDDSNIIDNYTYKNILEKLKNAEQVSNEEYEYVHKFKYKISSKEELIEIINNYSEKNHRVNCRFHQPFQFFLFLPFSSLKSFRFWNFSPLSHRLIFLKILSCVCV